MIPQGRCWAPGGGIQALSHVQPAWAGAKQVSDLEVGKHNTATHFLWGRVAISYEMGRLLHPLLGLPADI